MHNPFNRELSFFSHDDIKDIEEVQKNLKSFYQAQELYDSAEFNKLIIMFASIALPTELILIRVINTGSSSNIGLEWFSVIGNFLVGIASYHRSREQMSQAKEILKQTPDNINEQ